MLALWQDKGRALSPKSRLRLAATPVRQVVLSTPPAERQSCIKHVVGNWAWGYFPQQLCPCANPLCGRIAHRATCRWALRCHCGYDGREPLLAAMPSRTLLTERRISRYRFGPMGVHYGTLTMVRYGSHRREGDAQPLCECT